MKKWGGMGFCGGTGGGWVGPVGAAAMLAASSWAASPVPERFGFAYGSYLGGPGSETVRAIATGPAGRVWVAGYVGPGNLAGRPVVGVGNCYLAEVIPASGEFGSLLRLPDMVVNCLALDAAGNIFVGGTAADGSGFIQVDPISAPASGPGGTDGVLVKVAPDGRTILRAGRLGGSGNDGVNALWPDGTGGVFVAGGTESDDFPVARAIAPARVGGRDGFLSHVPAAGPALAFSTYLGGSLGEEIRSMTRLANGDLAVAGGTGSSDLPGPAVGQKVLGGTRDGFVMVIAADGSRVRWSTLVGGANYDDLNAITTDPAGQLVAVGGTESVRLDTTGGGDPLTPPRTTGRDVLVVRIAPDGGQADLRMALGGALDDEAWAVAVDATGRMVIAGSTESSDFPVRGAVIGKADNYSGNLFVTELDHAGVLVRSTHWGSRADEYFGGMALDGDGRVVLGAVTGFVEPGPFMPVTGRAVQGIQGGGYGEGHLALLSRTTAVPENDSRVSAPELNFREFTAVVNLAGAGREAAEPLHREVAAGGSVWWRWKAAADGWVRLSTVKSEIPVAVALYEERATVLVAVEMVPPEPGPGGGRFAVRGGGDYFIALAAVVEGESGAASLHLEFSGLANDDFDRRERITGLPFGRSTDLTQVTCEVGESSGVDVNSGGSADPAAWWSWTADRTGKFVWRAEGEDGFWPFLQVLRGSSLETLSNVALYNSATNAPVSQIVFRAEAGQEYQLRAAGRLKESGRARISLEATNLAANDDFAGRVRLPSERRVSATGNLRVATIEPGEPRLGGDDFIYGSGLSLWWAWSSPTNGLVRVSTAGSTSVTGAGPADTWLGVFAGNDLGLLREVATNDNEAEGVVTSALYFRATEGEEYQFYISGERWERNLGPVVLTVTVVDPPAWVPGAQGIDGQGRFRGRFRGLTGVRYGIEAAERVGAGATWVPVGEIEAGVEPAEFVDETAAGRAARYYRIVLPAVP